MKQRVFILRNDKDNNDYFEVPALSLADAMAKALSALGWTMTIQKDKEKEVRK